MGFHKATRTTPWLIVALLAVALATPSRGSDAVPYPTQRITIISGFGAGGSVDAMARTVAEGLQRKWGQPVIVENRSGAGGDLAAAAVARSAPGGHTILFTATALVINQYRNLNLPFTVKDLMPIAFTTVSGTTIVVNESFPIRSMSELVKLGRERPLTVGTSAAGSAGNIVGEYFFNRTVKLSAVIVPYAKGAAPAITDLLGNHVNALAMAASDVVAHVRRGTFRGLAVTSARRSLLMPDVPTTEEAGFPGTVSYGWTAMLVPAKTHPEIVAKLSAAVSEIFSDPDVKKQIEAAGYEGSILSHKDALQFFSQEDQRWRRFIEVVQAPSK
jgi:tripartite-type tricarboxylate transporter receptor subunit TctC